MAEIVQLNQPISATEAERQRFEAWAGTHLRGDERTSILARSKGGDYVLGTARAGWAAWQARGLFIIAGRGKITSPAELVLAIEAATGVICEQFGFDPAEGTQALLTAAAHIASIHAEKPAGGITETLAKSLGCAVVSADAWFKAKR